MSQTVMRVPRMMGCPERTPDRTTTREDVRSAAITLIVVQLRVFSIGYGDSLPQLDDRGAGSALGCGRWIEAANVGIASQ